MRVTPPEQPSEAPPPLPADRRKLPVLASAALVLGLCSFICHPVGLVLGIAGIVLGFVALAGNVGGQERAFNGIVLGTLGIVIVQMWLVPGVARNREVALGVECRSNLSKIGKEISMYAALNQDAFPADLEALVTEQGMSRKMLQCPSAGGKRQCDYFYFYLPPPGEPAEDPADIADDLVLACDLRGNHREGRNVVYASGEVKWFEEKDFQAELAKPINAAFAAALKEAEGE